MPDRIPDFECSRHGYFGIDIGGTLCKICFYQPHGDQKIAKLIEFITNTTTYGRTGKRDAKISIVSQFGQFHFIIFETHRMESAVQLIREADLFSTFDAGQNTFSVTGGGALKFAAMFDLWGVVARKTDEIKSLVSGLNFLLTHLPDECFYFPIDPPASQQTSYDQLVTTERRYIDLRNHRRSPEPSLLNGTNSSTSEDIMFPYILVNIGTGVSFIKVHQDGSYERISGSGMGGGTYWGLARLLTKCQSFDDSLKLSAKGKTRNVDMTVGDIYGGDYTSLGLPADMTASFFGKFTSLPPHTEDNHQDAVRSESVSDADICRALLMMVTNNIGQIAFLLAKLHLAKHIFFSGSFLRHSSEVDIAPYALSRAISFWSGNEMRALFLRHEGYFGALGAFLSTDEDETAQLISSPIQKHRQIPTDINNNSV